MFIVSQVFFENRGLFLRSVGENCYVEKFSNIDWSVFGR